MINRESPKSNGFFLIGILLLAFSNIFAVSGYASYVFYTELATLLTLVLLMIALAINSQKPALSLTDVAIFMACILYGALILFNWRDFYQLTNILTLFGILIWTNIFSKMQLDKDRCAICGVACSIYSLVMIFLFLPGNMLSGWNENSSICVLPVAFFGIACLMLSQKKWRTWAIAVSTLGIAFLIMQLENRSAFLSLILFLIVCFIKKIRTSRVVFRIFYISIIALNLLLPLFFEIAIESTFVNRISNFLLEVFNKNGLNGREEIWELAVERIRQNPWFGTIGYRTTYFHNFSLDILVQFGWIGWIIFFAALIFVLEKSFKENETRNLFLLGFLCLIFLNTFESVLFCNNYFMLFPYLLLGACWKKDSTEKVEGDQEIK